MKLKSIRYTNYRGLKTGEISFDDHLTVIVGKNGAGKSTLVRAILRDVPTEGTIEYRDTKNGKMKDLKNFLESIGFMSVAEIDNAFKSHQNNNNVVLLRAKGLDEKLSELDIVAILLNMANYRGYSDFYEEEDKKKRGKLEQCH